MNERVWIAQADTTPAQNPAPLKVVTVVKPGSEQAITIDLGYDQKTKVDLSAVANEKMTMVHVGTKLIVLFDNHSTVTIEPFFDSTGKPLANLDVNLGAGHDVTGDQFAALFPITEDQSVLPAAGGGGSPASGADFHSPTVDPLAVGNPLPLLGPESLGTFQTINPLSPQILQDFGPTVSGSYGAALVLEADLDTTQDGNDLAAGLTTGTDPLATGETTVLSGVTFTAGSQPIDVTFGNTAGVTVTEGGNTIQVFWVASPDGTHLDGYLVDPATHQGAKPAIELQLIDPATNSNHVGANGTINPVVTVTLTDAFPHNASGHDTIVVNGVPVVATDSFPGNDGTRQSVTTTLEIDIQDDTPTSTGEQTASPTLDDDGFGHGNLGGTDDVANADHVHGGAGALFTMGADGFKSITLDNATVFKAIFIDGNGVAHQEDVTHDAGVLNVDGSTTWTFSANAIGTVATLTIGADGSYDFTTHAPLVHPTSGTTEEDLPLTFGYTVTDGDNDTTSGSLTINVNDDTPVVTGQITLTDNENDIFTLWSQGTSPFDGHKDGSDTDLHLLTFGTATVSGQLSDIVSPGADGLQGYSFVSDQAAVDYFTGLHLFSKQTADSGNGIELTYSVIHIGDTVTLLATEPPTPGIQGSGNPVFTFTLNEQTGEFTFHLFDELVHVAPGTPNADSDFDLRSGTPIDGVQQFISGLNFGHIIQVTDGDGDTITLDNAVTIKIHDDAPVADIDLSRRETVTIDETPGIGTGHHDNTTSSSVEAHFIGVSNPGDDPDVSGQGAISYARSGDPIVFDDSVIGADAPAAVRAFSLALNGSDGMDSGLKLTDGTTIHLTVDSNGRILGVVDNDNAHPDLTGKTAFAIAIESDGHIDVAQYLSLQNDLTNHTSYDETVNLGNTIKAVLTVTDSDGDTSVDNVVVGSRILFADDGPSVTATVSSEFSVTHDETLWQQSNGADDIFYTPVFDHVANPGYDPESLFGLGLPLGYAQSETAALTVTNLTFGSDGAATSNSEVFSLSLLNANGAAATAGIDSGLKTTEGHEIFLFQEGGLIVGRYDTADGAVTNTSGHVDPAAFAIAIDPATGIVSMVQYVSLFNNGANDSNDITKLAISAANGSLQATVTVTDGDNDVATASADLSGTIQFRDDGPSIVPFTARFETVDEDDISTAYAHGSSPNDGAFFDGSFTGSPSDNTPGPADVFGTLAGSVYFGVDGANTNAFSFTSNAASTLTGLGLSSHDQTLSYLVSQDGKTITGFVDTGAHDGQIDGNEHAVFTLTLQSNGQFTFSLYDSLDHTNGNGQNTRLDATPDTTRIDFGSIIQATDGDNDSIVLSGQLKITIRDDVPTAYNDVASVIEHQSVQGNVIAGDSVTHAGADTQGADGAQVSKVVGYNGSSDSHADQIGNFSVNGHYGTLTINEDGSYTYTANPNINNASPVTDTFTYTLTDGDGDPSTATLKITISDGADPTVTGSISLTVNEAALDTQQTDHDLASGLVTGTNPSSPAETDQQTGITFTAHSDSITGITFGNVSGINVIGADPTATFSWTINSHGQLEGHLADGTVAIVLAISGDTTADAEGIGTDHTATPTVTATLTDDFPHAQGNGTNSITITGITLIASDTDNDHVASANVGVTIVDDMPQAPTIDLTTSGTNSAAQLIHDETAGVQGNPADDVASLPSPFAGDTALPDAATAIGFASRVAITVTPHYGADSNGTTQIALTDSSGNAFSGAATNFFDTATGNRIYLYTDTSGNVLGLVGTGSGTNTADSHGAVAFAVGLDQGGNLSFAEYRALMDNPTTVDDPNDFVTLRTPGTDGVNIVYVTAVSTDGDGDQNQNSAALNIQVRDDGPTLTVAAPDSLTNSLFFDGFTPNNNAWGTGSGIDATGVSGGWTIASSGTGSDGSGTVQLERVGDGYQGMHSSTHGFMVDLDASARDVKLTQTVGGLTTGESYVLTFEAGAPFPNSAHLEVWFGGQKVFDLNPSHAMQTYSLELFGGSGDGSNALEFRETGTPDNQGTYIANVHMNDVIVIDETAGHDSDSNETTNINVTGLFSGLLAEAGHDTNFGAPQYATGSSAAVNYVANFGTDGPKDSDHNGQADADAVVYSLIVDNDVSGLTTTDGGHAIHLVTDGNFVVGRYDSHNSGNLDSIAFAFSIDPQTGVVSVAQFVALEHPDHTSSDEGIYLNGGSLSAQVTITDGDGDHAFQSADISNTVRFEDDGPALHVTAITGTGTGDGGDTSPPSGSWVVINPDNLDTTGTNLGGTGLIPLNQVGGIIVDESAGNQPFTNDVNPNNLFDAVAHQGSDPDMTGGPQFATGLSAVVNVSANFGADGPWHGSAAEAVVYTLSTLNGADSGLTTTAGQSIHLFNEPYGNVNYVVGRFDSNGDQSITSADDAAFAFRVDPTTGVLSLVQFVSLHQPDIGSNNEGVSLNVNSLSVTVVVTDGDGDTATQSVDISNEISFDDDGPTAGNYTGGNYAEGSGVHDVGVAATLLQINAGADGLQNVTFSNGDHGGSLSIDNNGHLIYTPPADVVSATTVTETFNYTVTDGDNDTITKQITFGVTDTGVVSVTATDAVVDEDDIPVIGNHDDAAGDDAPTVSDHISYTLGADAVQSVALSANTAGITKLDGTVVHTSWDAGSHTLIGYGTNINDVVFTIVVTNVTNTGADYKVTLVQPIDHPSQTDPSNPNSTSYEDNKDFTVTATVTDSDGSQNTANFTVSIDDDSPVILSPEEKSVSEADLASSVAAHGSLDIHFGADGPSGPATPASGGVQHTINFDDAHNGTLPGNTYTHDGFTFQTDQGIANVTDHAGQIYGTAINVSNGGQPFTITQMDLGLFGASTGVPADNVRLTGVDATTNQTIVVIFNVGTTISLGDSATTFHAAGTAFDGVSLSSFKIESIAGWQGSYIFNGSVVVDNVVLGSGSAPLSHGDVSFTDLTTAINNIAIADDQGHAVSAATLTSHGDTVHYALLDSMTLVGYTGNTAPTAVDGANVVFSVVLSQDSNNPNGAYDFTLKQPLDDLPSSVSDLKFTFDFTAKDGDGDATSGHFTVDVQDAVPHPVIATTDITLTIDETAGDQPGTDDILGSTNTPVPSAFDALQLGTPIEIAQSNGAIVSSSGSYGADEQGSAPTYALLVAPGGVDSGLTATDGNKIFLYEENGLVIGRESTGAIGDPAGAIAFAISLDSASGVAAIAEYTAIHHPDKTDLNDPVSMTNGALQATVTFTDGDGDHITSAPVSIGGQIHFLDDGPAIVTTPQNLIVNGSFEADTGLANGQWSIYHHVNGWSAGSDGVPFELQNNASIPAKDGAILVELDSDTGTGSLPADTTNHFNDTGHTNATIQQTDIATQAGQTYELTFWYAPRPGEAAGSGDMKVLWNNTEIETIHSTGLTQGEWQQYSVFVVGTGTGHDTVAFQGAGAADNFGALLDNVSLTPMTAVDEDGLRGSPNDAVTGNHDSQPGDANVPDNDHLNGLLAAGNGDGNEATATGVLNINWGADNYDAADTYSDANGFTQDTTANVALNGAGRSLTFTDNSVGIAGAADSTGHTLSSHGDAISFTLSENGTKLIGTAQHGTDPARTVLEVTLSDDGTGAFHVILHDALDQSAGGNENDIVLTFNYTATDSDGDTALGLFSVLVDDDMPVAVNDTNSVNESTTLHSDAATNVLHNDHSGADGFAANAVVGVQSGTDASNPVSGHVGQLVHDTYGDLTLNADGSYTYVAHSVGANVSDTFVYTVSDDDGDLSTATLTIDVNNVSQPLTITGEITGTVYEDALPNANVDAGLVPPVLTDEISGNLVTDLSYTGDEGGLSFSFTSLGSGQQQVHTTDSNHPLLTSDGHPVFFYQQDATTLIGYTDNDSSGTHNNGDTTIFTLTLNQSTGDYQFTLNGPIDQPVNPTEDTLTIDLGGRIQVTDTSDANDTQAIQNFTVNVVDDIPVPANQTNTVDEGAGTNLILMIDTSGSVNGTTLAHEKTAAINLLNAGLGGGMVLVVDFDSHANASGWLNVSDAITYINNLTSGGDTNYDKALQKVMDYVNTNPTPDAAQTVAYFLSDGQPTEGYISTGPNSDQSTWDSFLTTQNITVYGVNFSGTSGDSDIAPIAYPSDSSHNVGIGTSGTTLPGYPAVASHEVSGNVLTGEHFGADGAGNGVGLQSVTIGGIVYTYDSVANHITYNDGTAHTINGSSLTDVHTALGELDFNFATGAYTYSTNASVTSDQTETFHFVIVDKDGDTAGADLNITVHDIPNLPPHVALNETGPGGSVSDDFSSGGYSGGTGWGSNTWTEENDGSSGNAATNGHIRVSGGELTFRSSTDDGDAISRHVDLSGKDSATVSFHYTVSDHDGDDITVQAWNNQTNTWDNIGTIDGGHDTSNGYFSKALTADQIGANSGIRFVAADDFDDDQTITIDNIVIEYGTVVVSDDHTATFTEDGAAAAIAAASLITDSDDSYMSSAKVVLTNEHAGDYLAINGTQLHDGSAGTINGIGYTVSDTGSAITVNLTGSDSIADYQSVINAITYGSNSQDPSEASRTVEVTVTDAHGNVSNTADATITVLAVNDAPTLTADSNHATFTEGNGVGVQGAAVFVFKNAAVDTVESGQTIKEVDFTVSGLKDGANETIKVDGTTISLGGNSSGTTATDGMNYAVTVSGGVATVSLTLAAGISEAAAQALVNGIQYLNTNLDNPTNGDRTFTLTSISDNGGTDNGGHDTTSLSTSATVDVDPVNDPAVITDGLHVISNYGSDAFTVPDAAFLAYVSDPDTDLTITNTSDNGLTASHSSWNSWITINDDSSHPGGSLTFTVSGGVESGDVTYQPDTGDFTLNGTNGNDIIVAAAAQHTTITFASHYDKNDTITINVDGTQYSYKVGNGGADAETVYEGLRNGSHDYLHDHTDWPNSLTGNSVTISGDLGDTFTITSSFSNGSSPNQGAPSVTTTYDALTLNGNGGDDYLIGGNGDDTLSGGSGHNVMTGGNGADHFLFGNLLSGDDILDFSGSNAGGQGDVIDLLASVFGGGSGAIANADLIQVADGKDLTTASGPNAVDMGSSHFAYQQSTGQLFYDGDGGGAANRVLVAVFDNHAVVQATDIHKV